MRLILFILFSVSLHAYAVNEEPCDWKINPKLKHEVRVLFGRGLDDERHTAAYIGISANAMKHLISDGYITPSPGQPHFQINITNQHPSGRDLIRKRHDLEDEDHSREWKLILAKIQAVELAQTETVRARIEKITGHAVGAKGSELILDLISELGDLTSWKQPIEITFDEIADFIGSDQVDLFARELGWPVEGLDAREAWATDRLEALFTDLPTQQGYLLGLTPALLDFSQDSEHQTPKRIRLVDVTGIEPISDADYKRLEKVTFRTPN